MGGLFCGGGLGCAWAGWSGRMLGCLGGRMGGRGRLGGSKVVFFTGGVGPIL